MDQGSRSVERQTTQRPGGLIDRLLRGDIRALARAISLVEVDPFARQSLLRAASRAAGGADVIGFTGPPGAGKSTLLSAYTAHLRDQDKRVAIVAVDPTSPLSGGAVLGDRTRMGRHYDDPDVFIRSLASRGHLGGLCESICDVVTLIDAAGWETIILETVGAGQSETALAALADVTVVVSTPGQGDDIQALKAGILELADVLVVNKADQPDADRTERQLLAMLALRAPEKRDVPVVCTVATDGTGIDALASAVARRLDGLDRSETSGRAARRMHGVIVAAATREARALLEGPGAGVVEGLAAAVLAGELDPATAGRQALRAVTAARSGEDLDG